MKRILIVIVVLAGVGGLVALLSFKPKATTVAATAPKVSNTVAASPSPSSDSSSVASSSPAASAGKFKDGAYTGSAADTIFGTVQVQAVVSGGKLTDVKFLQMPNDQAHSQMVTADAEPVLKQEALAAQSAQVDVVSGATQTSQGFVQSLGAALKQAGA